MDPTIRLSGAAAGALPLTGVGGAGAPAKAPQEGAAGAAESFSALLTEAVTGLDAQQKAADEAMLKLATGQPGDVHDVMIAMEQASLGLQLAVQVRGKIIEAYQDVMRMQV